MAEAHSLNAPSTRAWAAGRPRSANTGSRLRREGERNVNLGSNMVSPPRAPGATCRPRGHARGGALEPESPEVAEAAVRRIDERARKLHSVFPSAGVEPEDPLDPRALKSRPVRPDEDRLVRAPDVDDLLRGSGATLPARDSVGGAVLPEGSRPALRFLRFRPAPPFGRRRAGCTVVRGVWMIGFVWTLIESSIRSSDCSARRDRLPGLLALVAGAAVVAHVLRNEGRGDARSTCSWGRPPLSRCSQRSSSCLRRIRR